MEHQRARQLARLCQSVDQGSASLYARFSRTSTSPSLATFWAHMAEEETVHTRLWTEVLDSEWFGLPGGVPSGLVNAELVRQLEVTQATLGRMLADPRAVQQGDGHIVRWFLVASHLELLMMSPIFRVMLARGTGGASAASEQEYAEHFREFIDAMAVHCSGSEEAALTTEILRQYLHSSADLAAALSAKARLPALIPICSWCKRVRVSDDEWKTVEEYLSQEVGAECTHGMCAQCGSDHFGSPARSAPERDDPGRVQR